MRFDEFRLRAKRVESTNVLSVARKINGGNRLAISRDY